MEILCTICARSGSKGIKNKNLLKLNDKTLIHIAIELAKKSKLFKKIIFSSDSNDYIKKAIKYGVDYSINRKISLSSDKAGKIDVIRDCLLYSERIYKKKFDVICDLDVTTPLKNLNDLKLAFKKFLIEKNDILFSVCESKKNPYFNMVEYRNNKYNLIKNSKFIRRQDTPTVYFINAGIYIWK